MPDVPPPPEPYQEAPADTFDPLTDWREALGEQQVGGGSAVSRDAQESIRCGYIKANKKRAAARYFLGLSYADAEPPWALHREPPARDPEWPQLRAHSVAFTDLVPKAVAQPSAEDPPPDPLPKLAKFQSPFYRADYNPDTAPAGDDGSMYFTGYDECLATVRFKSFNRVRFLPDHSPEITGFAAEYKRFTDVRVEGLLEELSTSGAGSALIYAEGPTADPTGPPKGVQYPADTWEYMAKKRIFLTWMTVPHEYLSADPFVLTPAKIDECVGCTNAEPFLGRPAGTLYLYPPKFTPALFPVAAASLAEEPTDTGDILSGWDVLLELEEFDPPKGNTTPESTQRGHNLFPWRGRNTPDVGGAELGKWLFCTRNGRADGPTFVPFADFNKIFQHVRDDE